VHVYSITERSISVSVKEVKVIILSYIEFVNLPAY